MGVRAAGAAAPDAVLPGGLGQAHEGPVRRRGQARRPGPDAGLGGRFLHHGRAHEPPGHRRHRVPGAAAQARTEHPVHGHPRPVFPGPRMQHGHGDGPGAGVHLPGGLHELPGEAAGAHRQLQRGDGQGPERPAAGIGVDARHPVRPHRQGQIPQAGLLGTEGTGGGHVCLQAGRYVRDAGQEHLSREQGHQLQGRFLLVGGQMLPEPFHLQFPAV